MEPKFRSACTRMNRAERSPPWGPSLSPYGPGLTGPLFHPARMPLYFLERHMPRTFLVVFLACLAVTFALARPAAAQSYWTHYFTVTTMAPDGAYGTATNFAINSAIQEAIGNCRRMSKTHGCGAYQTSVRGGWTLGIRCGKENILVADRDLKEAVRLAERREAVLRADYYPDMPPCVRVVTVDPNGDIVPPGLPTPAVR